MIISAGALFKAKDTGRCLFVLRSNNSSFATNWSLVGGKMHHKENVLEGLTREIGEELGFVPNIEKWVVFNRYESDDKQFIYHSLLLLTDKEFIPNLNDENNGYAWIDIKSLPKSLHPRLKDVLNSKILQDSIKNFE